MSWPYNARIEPTTNGPDHLGHAYACLVNRAMATHEFSVRFDDNQPEWVRSTPWRAMLAYKNQWIDDLDWLGVRVDYVTSNSELQMEAEDRLIVACHHASIAFPQDRFSQSEHDCAVRVGFPGITYSYTPYKTALKVIMDSMQGISLLVRGDDLLTESNLYFYYVDMFRLAVPQVINLPRLMIQAGGKMAAFEISKTLGNYKVEDFRKHGWDPSQVVKLLKRSCLLNFEGKFVLDNLKPQPLLQVEGEDLWT